jgi:hypothetical protein
VRESIVALPRATVTRERLRAACAPRKRLRTRPLTAQLKVLNRRSSTGVLREDTGQFAKK